jgi:hypothetical protein
MKNLVILLFMSFSLIACSGSQVNETKIKVAEEIGGATEGAFVSLAKKELSAEEFSSLSCESEGEYYGEKVTSKVKDLLKVKESDAILSKKSLAGSACRAVLPIALDYALDEADLRPCARKLGGEKVSKLGDLACKYVDSRI